MFAPTRCTPEQSRALKVLEESLPNFYRLLRPQMPAVEHFATGTRWFVPGKLTTSQIPRYDPWLWNQSRARKTVKDKASELEVCFFKLSSRKQRACGPVVIPDLKIWVFNIHILASNSHYALLWCERAEQPPSEYDMLSSEDFKFVEEKQNTTNPNEIFLHDLAFLSPFVRPEIALEFRWLEEGSFA